MPAPIRAKAAFRGTSTAFYRCRCIRFTHCRVSQDFGIRPAPAGYEEAAAETVVPPVKRVDTPLLEQWHKQDCHFKKPKGLSEALGGKLLQWQPLPYVTAAC